MHIAGRDHIYATEVNGNTTTLFGNGWYGLENGIKYTNIQIQRYTNTNTEWQLVLGQLCSIKYTNIPIQKCTNANTEYIGGGWSGRAAGISIQENFIQRKLRKLMKSKHTIWAALEEV